MAIGESKMMSPRMSVCAALLLLLLNAITALECNHYEKEEFFPSPSKRFLVGAITNTSRKNPKTYLCIKLVLLDKNGKKLSTLQTDVSVKMKWAIGWMKEKDIVVLASRDVGTTAYRIENDKLVHIRPTAKMKKTAERLIKLKYRQLR